MSTELTPERLAELRRLAEKATPGPWKADLFEDQWIGVRGPYAEKPIGGGLVIPGFPKIVKLHDKWRKKKKLKNPPIEDFAADAAYIAAANPAMVLDLLDLIDALERKQP